MVVFFDFNEGLERLIIFSGFASIAFASVAALYQKRLKRLMAYSTISHTGFILVAIGCNSLDSVKSVLIYLFIYVIMTLSIFAIILIVANYSLPKFLIN